jgi:hypothetical protein
MIGVSLAESTAACCRQGDFGLGAVTVCCIAGALDWSAVRLLYDFVLYGFK